MDHLLFAAFHDELEKIALSSELKRRALTEARRRSMLIPVKARRAGVESWKTTAAMDRRRRQAHNFERAINQPIPKLMQTRRAASPSAASKVEGALGIQANPVFSSSLKRRN